MHEAILMQGHVKFVGLRRGSEICFPRPFGSPCDKCAVRPNADEPARSALECGREAAALNAGAAAPAVPGASTQSSRYGDELKAAATRPQGRTPRGFHAVSRAEGPNSHSKAPSAHPLTKLLQIGLLRSAQRSGKFRVDAITFGAG